MRSQMVVILAQQRVKQLGFFKITLTTLELQHCHLSGRWIEIGAGLPESRLRCHDSGRTRRWSLCN